MSILRLYRALNDDYGRPTIIDSLSEININVGGINFYFNIASL